MRDKLLHPATFIALLALMIAIGGAGYAATQLPKNSVGTAQIKKNAVTAVKVKDGSLLARDFKAGQLPRGEKGERGPAGPAEGAAGGVLAGSYPNPQLAPGALGTSTLLPAYPYCSAASGDPLDNALPAYIHFVSGKGRYLVNSYAGFGVMTCALEVPPRARPTAVDLRYLDDSTSSIGAEVYCANMTDASNAYTSASAFLTTSGASTSLRTLRVPIDASACADDAAMYVNLQGLSDAERTIAAYRVFYSIPG